MDWLGKCLVSSDKSGLELAGDMFKGMFVGAAAGAAGAWAGGAVAGSITAGGFINGSLSGLAGGFGGGFVGCSGNAWLSGAGFGAGLKAGFVGGALSAAFSGLSGGLIRGFTDMAKGYSFWDGRTTSEFVIGNSIEKTDYKAMGDNYNDSFIAELNDESLKTRIQGEYSIKEGDLGIEKITTRTGERYGMTTKESYVNLKNGHEVAGYADLSSTGRSSKIHISPKYANALDVADFRAVAGHELIHAYHQYTFAGAFVRASSESVAYRYSANIYLRASQPVKAFQWMQNAVNQRFFGTPVVMKFPIFIGLDNEIQICHTIYVLCKSFICAKICFG